MNQAMKNVVENISVGSMDEFMLNNVCGTSNIGINPHGYNVHWTQYEHFLLKVNNRLFVGIKLVEFFLN